MRTPGYFLIRLSFRTADEIQRNIAKRGKQNAIFRRYHAKDDKEAIDTWRLDLDGIPRVFNVCSVTFARRLLTFGFQIELGVNTYATIFGTRRGTTNELTIGSDVANTRAIVSDIRWNKLKSRGGADHQNQVVGIARISLVSG